MCFIEYPVAPKMAIAQFSFTEPINRTYTLPEGNLLQPCGGPLVT